VLRVIRRTRWLHEWLGAFGALMNRVTGLRLMPVRPARQTSENASRALDAFWLAILALALLAAAWKVESFVSTSLSWRDVLQVFVLGLFTLTRVMVLIALATLVWVPIGVWLGLRPQWAQRAQPVAQFLAAFPANLFFPPVVLGIVAFHLNPEIWLTPLMILGTQWYILFNVIAGAAAFPGDLQEAASNFRVRGLLWWRRVMIPGIFPYFVTGAITASGGSWNAAIVAEVASWGNAKLQAHGLGAYIAQATDAGDTPKIVLGVVMMSLFVTMINRLLWRPLYAYSNRRLTIA
jgi:NitT/TauT family transport system permease protein